MKKVLIALVCIGFIANNSYAQNQKNCSCKGVAHHKVAAAHHKLSGTSNNNKTLPPYITVLAHVPNTTPVCPPPAEPCYTYRKDNIVVEECPATIYKSTGDLQYMNAGAYMGYYPNSDEARNENINPLVAPQHTVISNYKGIAPADGNSCTDCSPQ